MTWLKLDDGTWMEPWVVAVGDEAFGLYVRMSSYCAQYLTDGLVPAHIAPMLVMGRDHLIEALERQGMVYRTHVGSFEDGTVTYTGGLELPRFLQSNPTRAKVEADREMRAERAKAGARKRWENRT